MFKYGLELEAFCGNDSADGEITLPPIGAPTDGFPGILEFRSGPNTDLYTCYGEVHSRLTRFANESYPFQAVFSFPEYKFPRELLAEIRRRAHFKSQVDIQNLYGKKPRHLNGRTIASLQLNISNQISSECYHHSTGKPSVFTPAAYGLLDIPKIVSALDDQFENEIKESGRQKGEYAIKDGVRLEYRSLPCSAFSGKFVQRVLEVMKNV
jgi:hypothetical protein